MTTENRKNSGKIILFCFLGFFGTVTLVNSIFIYAALRSNTGVVTENAYEKGLAYNKVLLAAANQPDLKDKLNYQDGVISWSLSDAEGAPVTGGKVTASFIRPVQDGADFLVPLAETSPGTYEATPKIPLQGLWTTRLEIKWNNKQYQTAQDIIVK